MASFSRTFRTKSSVEPKVNGYRHENLSLDSVRSAAPLKDSKLAWDIYFQDDEKLMSYYMMTLMTGKFFGIEAQHRVANLPKDNAPFSNTNQNMIVDERELKLIFNSADTVIKYFKTRYANRPDLIKKFIEGQVPFQSSYTLMNIIMYYAKFKEGEVRLSTPAYMDNLLNNWEFFCKILGEITALQRVATGFKFSLFYAVLSYYYYETIPDRVEYQKGLAF